MSGALYNLAAMTVASTGTGTITLGSAATINGVTYLSFAAAGVPDGALVYYSILDPSGASEAGGPATYTASGTTLTRAPVTSTNSNNAINMSAGAIVRITPITSQYQEVLTAARTYYVRTNGSDSNTGLANTAAGAFLTIQKAVDTIATLNINAQTVTVQVADGTYTGAVSLKDVTGFSAPGCLIIQGNNATPANVVISTTSATAFTADGITSVWDIKDLKITVATSGNGLVATNSAKIRFGNLEFGAVVSSHIRADTYGSIIKLSSYAVSGAASIHWNAVNGGSLFIDSITITITGTPAFSGEWAQAASLSQINCFSITFVGTATGTRYVVNANSIIFTNAAGATYLPGNAAGSTASGGQYL